MAQTKSLATNTDKPQTIEVIRREVIAVIEEDKYGERSMVHVAMAEAADYVVEQTGTSATVSVEFEYQNVTYRVISQVKESEA